jgi:hypothetical protein
MDIIDQLAVLDLTETDLIECMYGYTEMEAFATYFDMDSLSLCSFKVYDYLNV